MHYLLAFASLTLFLADVVRAQAPADVMHAFVGGQYILVGFNGDSGMHLKRDKLDHRKGECDVAVVVRAAEFDNGTAKFQLTFVGNPAIVNFPPSSCRLLVENIDLRVSGFSDNEDLATLTAALKRVLQTPEEYLNQNGIEFRFVPGPDEPQIPQTDADPTLQHPRLLLRVDATYTEQARRAHFSGTVSIRLVVGIDGRAHQAQIVKALGLGLDQNALEALRMWRFEPGRKGSRVVSYGATIQMTFRIM